MEMEIWLSTLMGNLIEFIADICLPLAVSIRLCLRLLPLLSIIQISLRLTSNAIKRATIGPVRQGYFY